MWLGVDSGNSRLKWALFDRDVIVDKAVAGNLRALSRAAKAADACWVAHVGAPVMRRRLRDALSPCPRIRFLCSRHRALGVTNHYTAPAVLGVDRWLCLLAARRYGVATVVVSAGTALTIDALTAEGAFLGGVIMPGLSTMGASLSAATPLKFSSARAAPTLPPPPSPPRATAPAISTGIALAAAAAVREFRRRYLPRAKLLLTGGDAETLSAWLPSARVEKDLLFIGMGRLKAAEK